MGIFDIFRNEFIEVIDWVEQDGDVVLYKFPDKEADIKYGAQLTVRPSQAAVFLNEGQIADIYREGLHTLYTENMPVMTKLRNWDKFFQSPFKADIYFVSLKQFTQMKWGTSNPIILRDPQFSQVRVKAFGVYFMRVSDPAKFMMQYAGSKTIIRQSEIEESLRDLIAPKFAEAVAEANVSVLDLVSSYTELGDKILPMLKDDFSNFGLELTKFQITSTTLPEEVLAFYDKMTNMNMVKDMARFTQFETAQSIEKAAENPGAAGAMIGMGMGVNMGQMMNTQMSTAAQQVPNSEAAREEIMRTIRELGKLKDEGLINEDEYTKKKAELLARI
ncbi:MAG: SPFH domain-containing protein [Bacteroidota bacterium]|nr:SPFH domain-containing protein [Bacteroidota bacterium]